MENVFLATDNVELFNSICAELEDPMSMVGPSLAMVTGPAGRGKSEAAKRYATQTQAVYIPPMNVTSPMMLLREITFDLCKVKPGRIEGCLDVIGSEMGKLRRLVIVDEADLLPLIILEMLRNVNERHSCPILLIGEEGLKGRIASRRRLSSRVRRRMDFAPVASPDIVLFFRKAMRVNVSPSSTALIHKKSGGDWRPVLTVAADIERAMRASGIEGDPPDAMVQGIVDGTT